MKAAAFDYVKPATIDQVLALLQQHGDDARLLAGGQTLMATLNMRLSEPQLVIDITGIESLRGISVQGQVLRIG
jgi:carbon-monoxide dehydrogenase medium subunit